MLTINNQASQVIVVLHEIYGINGHIQSYAQQFGEMGYDVVCPNMLQYDYVFPYENEQQAYRNFMEHIGFEQATQQIQILLSELTQKYEAVYIVGFSIGATVAWLCSELNGIQHVIGYSGSRIRNYLNVMPHCPVTLFYGSKEKSFDVRTLLEALQKKEVQTFIFEGAHGFADTYANTYNESSSQQALRQVKCILSKA
ncbi:dienelactone hydrolase family protein [Metasolibacillus meyeri]|uniref:Dienelactone hydrolase family protein n=1 Tax=Metasolibacillus meyeri TaxID=1071052 RepID=A0AAW9NU18_9BACL|nr:dienelactone hydrolase family protein [Metasolibacillus meyeri]MEC1179931.1 dienelactone hydrolase family protein [Metasolibacillus meyeri]